MPASAALSHIKVIDLTRVRAGPTAVRQLADWGARVIKVEMPAGLDEGEGPGGPKCCAISAMRTRRSTELRKKGIV